MAIHPVVAANHAIGAMVMSLFGAIWIAVWCLISFGANYPILGFVTAATIIMSGIASKQFRTHRKAYGEFKKTPTGRRQNILMGAVNATQWVLIFAAVATLRKLEYSPYIVPGVILIVAIHFIPLAAILKYKPYLLTATALGALAVGYPLAAESGPASPIGLLGSGIILWATGVGLIITNAIHSSVSPQPQVDA
jgi:hypothetical protein